jgi:geranylgeranyl pyrophosphate synthase
VSEAADRRIAGQEEEDFGGQLESWRLRMERALAARLPESNLLPARLHEAMRYSVLGGGKRIRPALLFATAHALGLAEDEVEAAACAIELVHVYSLVHDDLPAMDNDDMRRGRPTCHKAFDEATALLVGDALQPLAFQLLACDPKLPASPTIRLRLIDMLAQAIGTLGMAGGQAIDLAAQGLRLDIGQVEDMHARKTGAVIRASVLMAAECAPSLDASLYAALTRFANAVGLAFQIQDDLLDVTGDAALLGKATGADSDRAKPTYPSVIGITASQQRIRQLHNQAIQALAPFGDRARILHSLAHWLLSRQY